MIPTPAERAQIVLLADGYLRERGYLRPDGLPYRKDFADLQQLLARVAAEARLAEANWWITEWNGDMEIMKRRIAELGRAATATAGEATHDRDS